MKKLFALLSVVLVVASCSKDIDTNVEFAGEEGAMRFGIATQADIAADESVVIKVYKVEGEDEKLIRRYDAIADVPEYLALLAGDYVAKVQVGQKRAVSFDGKYYYGEQPFTVKKGIVTPVTVDCKLISTIVTVNYDATVAEKLEEGYFTTVAIDNKYDEASIATGDILSLTYNESKDGYVMMPEGATSLYWHFEGAHPVEGDIVKEGLIENIKASARYTITLKYSADAPGNLVFEATVDESIEEFDDTIIFSPDPTILGDGFDVGEEQLSTAAALKYYITSLAPINVMTIAIDGREYNLLEDAPEGITLIKTDDATYTMEIASSFFTAVAGGEQNLTFHVQDVDGGNVVKDVRYVVQGILPISTYDLWFGTAQFEAVVTDGAAGTVKIAYSANGGKWVEVEATKVADKRYAASVADFSAATNYSYKLIVDGATFGRDLSVMTAAGAQLPNGDMERWHTNSWVLPYGEGDTPFWLTGNEGGNMAGATLTQSHSDVRPGSAGKLSAYLMSQKVLTTFAAGNLFTGTFSMNGLNGLVTFGRDFAFTAKPKSLSFWMKNNEGQIDVNSGKPASGTDKYSVMVIITDGTTYTVDTKDSSSFIVLEELQNMPGVIGYGYISGTDSRSSWTEETINITYREDMKSKKPRKIVVSFTPSGYGDYFCGSSKSWMYVDDIVLNY